MCCLFVRVYVCIYDIDGISLCWNMWPEEMEENYRIVLNSIILCAIYLLCHEEKNKTWPAYLYWLTKLTILHTILRFTFIIVVIDNSFILLFINIATKLWTWLPKSATSKFNENIFTFFINKFSNASLQSLFHTLANVCEIFTTPSWLQHVGNY